MNPLVELFNIQIKGAGMKALTVKMNNIYTETYHINFFDGSINRIE